MHFDLRPGEQIIKIFHRFGLLFFWHYFLVFLFIAAPFFFMFVLFSWGTWGIVLFSVSLGFGLLFFLRTLYFQRRNSLVVTTERVINIIQKSILNKLVIDLAYQNIHNVTYQIKGFFPTIFRFGLIRIQTTNQTSDLIFTGIKKPARAAEVISQVREDRLKINPDLSQTNIMQNKIADLISLIKKASKEDIDLLKKALEKRSLELK